MRAREEGLGGWLALVLVLVFLSLLSLPLLQFLVFPVPVLVLVPLLVLPPPLPELVLLLLLWLLLAERALVVLVMLLPRHARRPRHRARRARAPRRRCVRGLGCGPAWQGRAQRCKGRSRSSRTRTAAGPVAMRERMIEMEESRNGGVSVLLRSMPKRSLADETDDNRA